MPQILVLGLGDRPSDAGANREIREVSRDLEVQAAGAGNPGLAGAAFRHFPYRPKTLRDRACQALLLKSRRYEAVYWRDARVQRCAAELRDIPFDCIVANDVATLPLALRLAAGRKVIFDAHEYCPREYEDRLGWRVFFQRYMDYLCRTCLPRVDAMLTVCEGIASEFQRVYGVAPAVVTNTSDYHPVTPSASSSDSIRMAHHRAAAPPRKIENMTRVMQILDNRVH